MKTEIDNLKRHISRIRRNPDMTPTMVALSLDDIATALEKIDDRMTKMETTAGRAAPEEQRPGHVPIHLHSSCTPHDVSADWSVGSKF